MAWGAVSGDDDDYEGETIVVDLASGIPTTGGGEDEDEPYDRTDDFVLTDPEGMQVYNSLPDPSYRILIQSDYTMNWYGIHCIGDIVEGVVMSYGRRPSEQQPTKGNLRTWLRPVGIPRAACSPKHLFSIIPHSPRTHIPGSPRGCVWQPTEFLLRRLLTSIAQSAETKRKNNPFACIQAA